ncbi:MAG: hypothetical protein ACXAB2_13570 [Candidatus Hodarchaeales archaeon]
MADTSHEGSAKRREKPVMASPHAFVVILNHFNLSVNGRSFSRKGDLTMEKTGKKLVTRLDNHRPVVYESLSESDKSRVLEIQTKIEERLLNIKIDIFEIGKLLARAKDILPHGSFRRWVEETWGAELPYSTAACWKAIYSTFKDNPETVRLLLPGIRKYPKSRDLKLDHEGL